MDWLYFGLMIGIIIVCFVAFKRPMYEVMAIAFFAMTIILGRLGNIGAYFKSACNFSGMFMIAAFIIFGAIFERSGIIGDMIDIIVALVGRFSGGAGYVALLASSAMGALSATGPGNAAAVGTITIPAMKRSGFTPELAATVEMAASALGPVIPPSNTIVIMYTMLETLFPGHFTFSAYWLFSWVIAIWFIVQRLITLFILIKKNHVQPVPKEERLPIKVALKKGWQSLLLPVVVFLPLFLESMYHDGFVTAQLGSAGAANMTGVVMCGIPSLCIIFIIALCRHKGQEFGLKRLSGMVSGAMHSVAPVIVMVFFGFCISELFNDAGIINNIILLRSIYDLLVVFAADLEREYLHSAQIHVYHGDEGGYNAEHISLLHHMTGQKAVYRDCRVTADEERRSIRKQDKHPHREQQYIDIRKGFLRDIDKLFFHSPPSLLTEHAEHRQRAEQQKNRKYILCRAPYERELRCLDEIGLRDAHADIEAQCEGRRHMSHGIAHRIYHGRRQHRVYAGRSCKADENSTEHHYDCGTLKEHAEHREEQRRDKRDDPQRDCDVGELRKNSIYVPAYSIGGMIVSPFMGKIADATGGYGPGYAVLAVLCVVGYICTMVAYKIAEDNQKRIDAQGAAV